MSFGIQLRFPKPLPCVRIERAESFVDRAGDEHQSSSSRDRPALSERAGIVNALGLHFIAGSERYAPRNITAVGINGHQFPPGRLLAGLLRGGIPEAAVESATAERAEAAVGHLIAILGLVESAHASDIARIDEHVSEVRIHRD